MLLRRRLRASTRCTTDSVVAYDGLSGFALMFVVNMAKEVTEISHRASADQAKAGAGALRPDFGCLMQIMNRSARLVAVGFNGQANDATSL